MGSRRKLMGPSNEEGGPAPALHNGKESATTQEGNETTNPLATAAPSQADGDSDFEAPLKTKRGEDGRKKVEKKEEPSNEGKDGKVAEEPSPPSNKKVKRWREIESNPHVFAEMLKTMGVEGSSMQEVWDIDSMPDLVQNGDVYGLILLIRWSAEEEQVDRSQMDIKAPVYFAQQVVQNACATQALVAVALNTPGLKIGPRLTAFKERTKNLSYFTRGQALGDSTFLHAIHCHYSGADGIEYDEIQEEQPSKTTKKKGENKKETEGKEEKKPKKRQRKKKVEEEEVWEMPFHFITIIPAPNGKVYELDGLKEAPRTLGPYNQKDPADWLSVAREAILLRFAATDELEFQLMAVTESSAHFHARMIRDLEMKLALETTGEGENGKKKGRGGRGKPSEEETKKRTEEVKKQIEEHREKMKGNVEEREEEELEVERAIHNYDRFVEAFAISIAQKGLTGKEEVERLRAERKKKEEERVRKHKEEREMKEKEEGKKKDGEGDTVVEKIGGEEQEKVVETGGVGNDAGEETVSNGKVEETAGEGMEGAKEEEMVGVNEADQSVPVKGAEKGRRKGRADSRRRADKTKKDVVTVENLENATRGEETETEKEMQPMVITVSMEVDGGGVVGVGGEDVCEKEEKGEKEGENVEWEQRQNGGSGERKEERKEEEKKEEAVRMEESEREKEREDENVTNDVGGINVEINVGERKEGGLGLHAKEEKGVEMEKEKLGERESEGKGEGVETNERKGEHPPVVEENIKRGRGKGTRNQGRKGKKAETDNHENEGKARTISRDGQGVKGEDVGGKEESAGIQNTLAKSEETRKEGENEGKEETREAEEKGAGEVEKESLHQERNEGEKVECEGKEETREETQAPEPVAPENGKQKTGTRAQGGGGRRGRKGKMNETNEKTEKNEEEKNTEPVHMERSEEEAPVGVGVEKDKKESGTGEEKMEEGRDEKTTEMEGERAGGVVNKEEGEAGENTVEIEPIEKGKSKRKSGARAPKGTGTGRRKGKKVAVVVDENEEKEGEKTEKEGGTTEDVGVGGGEGKEPKTEKEGEKPADEREKVESVGNVIVGKENTVNMEDVLPESVEVSKTGQEEQVGTEEKQEDDGKEKEEVVVKGRRKETKPKSRGRKGKKVEDGVNKNVEGDKGEEGSQTGVNSTENGETGGVVATKQGEAGAETGKTESEAAESVIVGNEAETGREKTGEENGTRGEEKSAPDSVETSTQIEITAKKGRGRATKKKKEEEKTPDTSRAEDLAKPGRGRQVKGKNEDEPVEKMEQQGEPQITTAPVPETHDESRASTDPEKIEPELEPETLPTRTGRKRAAPPMPPPTDKPRANKRGRMSNGRNTIASEPAATTETTEPIPKEPETDKFDPTRKDDNGLAGKTGSEDTEQSKPTPKVPEFSKNSHAEKSGKGDFGERITGGEKEMAKENTPRKRKAETVNDEFVALQLQAALDIDGGGIATRSEKRQRKQPERLQQEEIKSHRRRRK
eukprot:comp22343_c0_seq1/m.33240 comp22343_c0_seq1/g.33240  ORF comp22343_c0_seq1/g.33240 comp22343_c0_seq1/m.33240 type:complete len:1490 (-) comp22343_c0_seq1:13-4482(-)